MSDPSPCFVGIDVSKESLEVFVRPLDQQSSLPNTPKEVAALVSRLKPLAISRVIIEATGGLETLLVSELAAAGLPVAVINPRQARDFAKATGQLAKTDRIDAGVLAHFGEAIKTELRPLPSGQALRFEALLVRRRQLVDMVGAEKNRLSVPSLHKEIRRDITLHIQWLEKRIARTDSELGEAVEASEAWRVKDDLLRSVKGVGEVTSRTLLALLPELGEVTNKQITSLAGLAPFVRQSGRWKGECHIGGGRASIRQVLYMATLSAIRCNRVIRAFYQRLLARGKKRKVALVACMRKLLVILNSIVKHQRPWSEQQDFAQNLAAHS